MATPKKPKQIRVSSAKIKCKVCGKEVYARGYTSHMRLVHLIGPDKEELKAVQKVSNQAISGVKTKIKPKPINYTWDEMIVTFGLAWILSEITKAIQRENKYQTPLLSELNKPTQR